MASNLLARPEIWQAGARGPNYLSLMPGNGLRIMDVSPPRETLTCSMGAYLVTYDRIVPWDPFEVPVAFPKESCEPMGAKLEIRSGLAC